MNGRAGSRLAALLLLLMSAGVSADRVRVAVASNFRPTLDALVRAFESASEHRVEVVSGSTGKLYAQIVQGAPFDLLLAADAERPRRLEAEGRTQPGSRFTYAIGRLVLWSPDPRRVDGEGQVLKQRDFRYLAIANPRLAPYGRAARQLLQAMGLWTDLQGRLLRGENIAQAYHFVASGNAELGLVAWSQLRGPAGRVEQGFWWLPPGDLHEPIEQQLVLLNDRAGARAFHAFLAGAEARRIIESHGYERP